VLDDLLDLDVDARQPVGQELRGAGAEFRALVNDDRALGDLAGAAVDAVERLDRLVDAFAEARLEAEHVVQPAIGDQVGGPDIDDVRDAVLGGGLARGQHDGALEAADDRGDASLVHLLDLGDADLDLRLGVAQHRLEPRAAHRPDAAGGVDLVDGELRAEPRLGAAIGDESRDRMEQADADRPGLGAGDPGCGQGAGYGPAGDDELAARRRALDGLDGHGASLTVTAGTTPRPGGK
jgi:hypothetical protein